MSDDHPHRWVMLRSDPQGFDNRRICADCEVLESRASVADFWIRDPTRPVLPAVPRVPAGYQTSVTGLRANGGGIGPELEVEVTVSRVPSYMRLPGLPPSPADVPPDVRDQLRAWLNQAEMFATTQGGTDE